MIKEGSGGVNRQGRKSIALFNKKKYLLSNKASTRSISRMLDKHKKMVSKTDGTLANDANYIAHISKRNVKTKGLGMKESLHSMLEGSMGKKRLERVSRLLLKKSNISISGLPSDTKAFSSYTDHNIKTYNKQSSEHGSKSRLAKRLAKPSNN